MTTTLPVMATIMIAEKYRLKKIVEWATEAKFTHILVLSEKAKATNG